MIVSSMSIYAAAAFAPAGVAAAPAARAEAPRPAAAPVSAPPPVAQPDEEAVLRERYFEEMVSSAADLLLRTQTGQASRFDP